MTAEHMPQAFPPEVLMRPLRKSLHIDEPARLGQTVAQEAERLLSGGELAYPVDHTALERAV
jgi:hypothetical protein